MVWKGTFRQIDLWGSLVTSILTTVLPGDRGGDALSVEPRKAIREGVKTGVNQPWHSQK